MSLLRNRFPAFPVWFFRGLAFMLLLLAGVSKSAEGQPFRLVLSVGNDVGLEDDLPLRYAVRDAKRVRSTLESLGGAEKSWLLVDQDASRLQEALGEIGRFIAEYKRFTSKPAQLLVYYSGHADERFLHLSESRLTMESFKNQVMQAGADLTIVVLDACRNRLGTEPKGVRLDSPFDVRIERGGEAPRGSVWIQSVRNGEVALESEALAGSIFTHHWIASLQGAADFNGDCQISLFEAYVQARAKTQLATLRAIGQPLHPDYNLDLHGEEDVILTRLERAKTRLVFPENLIGHFYVAERYEGNLCSELTKDEQSIRILALPRGDYLVFTREESSVRVAEVSLLWIREKVLNNGDFREYPKAQVMSKGGRLRIRTFALSVGAEVDSGFLDGMSIFPLFRLDASKRFGRLELVIGFSAAQTSFEAQDSRIQNRIIGCNLGARISFPQSFGIWLTQLEARPTWMHQQTLSLKNIGQDSDSDVFVMQLRLSQQFRLLLSPRTSLSIGIGLSLSGFRKEDHPEVRFAGFGLISYQILL